jgi:hypothetical protein
MFTWPVGSADLPESGQGAIHAAGFVGGQQADASKLLLGVVACRRPAGRHSRRMEPTGVFGLQTVPF